MKTLKTHGLLSPYILHLADNALILAQRQSEWCGHGPMLEEDLALTNHSLDLIGQARWLYQIVVTQETHAQGLQSTEDDWAYFRHEAAFRNFTLVELPHHTAILPTATIQRDYAVTMMRHYLYSLFAWLQWRSLQTSTLPDLAALAAKAVKESQYHVRHARDWVIRLGDGTSTSHQKMQAALDYLMPKTQEFWIMPTEHQPALAQGVAMDTTTWQAEWQHQLTETLHQATLNPSPATGRITTGSRGIHSEHMGYLLAEMQSLARAHPGAVWA